MSGLARLEFAVSVIVLGVIAALALDHIARLQVAAGSTTRDTGAAQARAAATLAQTRCAESPTGRPVAAETPSLAPASPHGTARRVDSPVPPCP